MEIQKKNAQFEKEDNATPEKKLAAEFGMTAEELQQKMEPKQMPLDPKIEDQSKLSQCSQHCMEKGEEVSLSFILMTSLLNHSLHSSHHCPLPPPDLHLQFTIGSLVCVGEPLYGVIQWVGTVPDFTGTIAGVELVAKSLNVKCVNNFL